MPPSLYRSIDSQRGFTIVEALFVLGISLMLSLAALTLQKDVFMVNGAMSASLTAQGELRAALRRMASEMRMATTANDGSYPIAVATASDFTFFADTDGDGVREQIRYYADGTRLMNAVTEPTGDPLSYADGTTIETVVVTDLSNGSAVFEYFGATYNGSGDGLSSPVDIPSIRLVRTTLSVDRDAFRLPGVITLTTVAALRNVKTNL